MGWIFVAQGDGRDLLGQQVLLVVADQFGLAGVRQTVVAGLEQSEGSLDLAEEQGSGIGGEPSALEISEDVLGSEAGKGEGLGGTVCHARLWPSDNRSKARP